MSDEELLNKYHHYIKKRRIVISLLLFFLIIIAVAIIHYFTPVPQNESITEKEVDHTPPVITLKTKNISIYQNETIDYLSYVESVQDDKEGDLKDKLQYDEIDTSNIGNFEIIYSVSDSSNNTNQSKLIVEIKEKKIESSSQEEINPSSNNPSNNPSSSIPHNNNNTQKPSNNSDSKPSSDNTSTNKPTNKIVKYFLFEDGYTMVNVAEVCASELKKLGVAGMCSPVQNSAGIYLGMKLETN